MKKLIKLPFKVLVVVLGLTFTSVLFILVVPIRILEKFWKFLKRIAENTKRLFNFSIKGYWIYF